MGKARDLTGMRFGRLVVVERAQDYVTPKTKKHRKQYMCVCDCGNSKIVLAEALSRGLTTSCGCYHKERVSATMTTHGLSNSRLYTVWCSMKSRCYCVTEPTYKLYGARGITMCDEWKNDFSAFHDWAFAHGYDENAQRGACTIDRIDNNLGYSPANCRFISQQEQMNNVRYNHYEEMNGERLTVAQWAERYDMPYSKLLQRLTRYGMPIEEAVRNI